MIKIISIPTIEFTCECGCMPNMTAGQKNLKKAKEYNKNGTLCIKPLDKRNSIVYNGIIKLTEE